MSATDSLDTAAKLIAVVAIELRGDPDQFLSAAVRHELARQLECALDELGVSLRRCDKCGDPLGQSERIVCGGCL